MKKDKPYKHKVRVSPDEYVIERMKELTEQKRKTRHSEISFFHTLI